MPLVLSRKQGEAIRIGPNITITLGETRGSYTEILIDAPRSVPVWRAEIENFHAGGDNGNSLDQAAAPAGSVRTGGAESAADGRHDHADG